MMNKWVMAVIVGLGVAGLAGPQVATAADSGVAGKKALLKASKKVLLLVKNDAGIVAPTQEELDGAASVGGAFLTVCADNGESGSHELDPAGFSRNKKGVVKYTVKGTAPVKKVLIKSGRTLKVVGSDSIVPMEEGEELVAVSFRLSIGAQRTCTTFEEPNKDDGKLFKAKNGEAPDDCDDVTLGCDFVGSPSGAFVR